MLRSNSIKSEEVVDIVHQVFMIFTNLSDAARKVHPKNLVKSQTLLPYSPALTKLHLRQIELEII